MDDALELWERWFDEFGEPWFLAHDKQAWCVFCDGRNGVHDGNCIYLAAAALTGRDNVTRTDDPKYRA